MKLRTGRSTYKLPPHYQILHVCIHAKDEPLRLHLYQASLEPRRTRKPGRPTAFALIGHDKIEFRPTPDKPYSAEILFSGPLQTC